jgi:hypothetical protein
MAGTQVVVVPAGPVRERILAMMHDAAWAGHMGVTKTLERVSRMFWWQSMRTDVRHYVATCDSCQRNKALRMKPAGLLNPLSIPGWRWESVSMDLVVKLTPTKSGFDSICVFVDRLSKMVHLVPCRESMTALEFAKLFRDAVFRHHGMPVQFVSDRGAIFHSHFHDALTKLLGVEQCMSTAYHPQSDGQTEVYNGVMQEVLRHYVSPVCNDWDEHLACAEFAINESWNETIQNTPFFVNYGQHPLTPMVAELREGMQVPSAKQFAEHWQSCVARARRYMQQAQERMKRSEDKHRRAVAPYKPGDLVLLSTRNLQLKTGVSSRKMLPRYVGPFKVKGMVGSSATPTAVRIELPHNLRRLHPVFHTSLLKPYKQSEKRPYLPPPPIDWLDDEPWYSVEYILDHRDRRYGRTARREYLIKWLGYGPEHNSWEPSSHVTDVAIKEYHKACGHGSPEPAAQDSDASSDDG